MTLRVWAVLDPKSRVRGLFAQKPSPTVIATPYHDDNLDTPGIHLPKEQEIAQALGYRLVSGKLNIELKQTPRLRLFPFVFVWNDASRQTLNRLLLDSKIKRYQIGQHNDGSKNDWGLYLHGEDLMKFMRFLRKRGMLGEVEIARDALRRYRELKRISA